MHHSILVFGVNVGCSEDLHEEHHSLLQHFLPLADRGQEETLSSSDGGDQVLVDVWDEEGCRVKRVDFCVLEIR